MRLDSSDSAAVKFAFPAIVRWRSTTRGKAAKGVRLCPWSTVYYSNQSLFLHRMLTIQTSVTLRAGSSAELEDWKKALDLEVAPAAVAQVVGFFPSIHERRFIFLLSVLTDVARRPHTSRAGLCCHFRHWLLLSACRSFEGRRVVAVVVCALRHVHGRPVWHRGPCAAPARSRACVVPYPIWFVALSYEDLFRTFAML